MVNFVGEAAGYCTLPAWAPIGARQQLALPTLSDPMKSSWD